MLDLVIRSWTIFVSFLPVVPFVILKVGVCGGEGEEIGVLGQAII